MPARLKIPIDLETRVLIECGRRCCLCYGLKADQSIKRGQIAHIDQNRENNSYGNLVFLCLEHHDEYDSTTSQSKGLTSGETQRYRDLLNAQISRTIAPEQKLQEFVEEQSKDEEVVIETSDRILDLARKSPENLGIEIRKRLHAVVSANNELYKTANKIPLDIKDGEFERRYDLAHNRCHKKYKIPKQIYGLSGDGIINEDWYSSIEPLIEQWAQGLCSYADCGELFWELDETYDLDYYYILYGVPHGLIPVLGLRYLTTLIYEIGGRNLASK